MSDALPPALVALRAAGHRITAVRAAVYATVAAAEHAVSHADCERRLGPGFDKVSIYRALEWLETQGAIHRLASRERVWLFSVGSGRGAHLHFTCRTCGTRICLDAGAPPPVALPAGYRCDEVEVLARGCCPDCAARDDA